MLEAMIAGTLRRTLAQGVQGTDKQPKKMKEGSF